MGIRHVTRDEMIEIDRIMIDEFHINPIILIENTAKSLAVLTRELLNKDVYGKEIAILVGKGNNATGGLAAARHLHNWGANVEIITTYSGVELMEYQCKELDLVRTMGISVIYKSQKNFEGYDLLIDAILGYDLNQNLSDPVVTIINDANESRVPTLALDLPSGLDATSGIPYNPTIRATTTMSLGIPKRGLMTPQAKPYVGSMYLADISIPRVIYSKLGEDFGHLFSKTFIVRINY